MCNPPTIKGGGFMKRSFVVHFFIYMLLIIVELIFVIMSIQKASMTCALFALVAGIICLLSIVWDCD